MYKNKKRSEIRKAKFKYYESKVDQSKQSPKKNVENNKTYYKWTHD